MNEEVNDDIMDNEERAAWLEIGGYVAAADGLSDQERDELANSAAGPGFDRALCVEAIQKGGSSSSLPSAALERVSKSDIFVRVQLLLEIFGAAASDGLSAPELKRLNEATEAILGSSKQDAFMRLCEVESEAAQLRHTLVFGE